jgi:hypothetical protein
MTETDRHDRLIARLRERVADPDRRLDARPSQLFASMTAMNLGDMFRVGRALTQDLRRLFDQGPTPDLVAKANAIEQSMSTPEIKPLPKPATEAELAAAEARMTVRLPPLLRRLYLDLANGGFGPGYGILGVAGGWTTDRAKSIEDLYAEMSEADNENARWIWPVGLVPIVDLGGSFACVDTTAHEGRVVIWDPDELDGRGRDGGWSRSFTEETDSLEAWLERWLDAHPPRDSYAEMMAELSASVPEVTRAYWASMSPEERADYGLPPTGWGRVLFGDAWGNDPRDQA